MAYDALLAKLDKVEDRKQFLLALTRKIGEQLSPEPLTPAWQAAAAIRALLAENEELRAKKAAKK
jgi:hypothetical protein